MASAKPLSLLMGTSLPFEDVQAEGTVVSIHLGVPTAEALQYCAVVGSTGYGVVIHSSALHNAQCPLSFLAHHGTSMLMCHHAGPAYVTAVGILFPFYRKVY